MPENQRRTEDASVSHYFWAALFILVLFWSTAYAAQKNCGSRSEIQTHLQNQLQQRKVGFTVSSSAGRLELWTTQPMEVQNGMFIAERWSGISVKKDMCIEVQGTDWIFMSWELG